MGKRIRVMIVHNPDRTRSFSPLLSRMPSDFKILLVGAKLQHSPLRSLPTRRTPGLPRLIRELVRFRPQVIVTDNPTFPAWISAAYNMVGRDRVPIMIWIAGDLWIEHSSYFSEAQGPMKWIAPLYQLAWLQSLRISDLIVPACRWLDGVIKKHLPHKKTRVLYQAIDPVLFRGQGSKPYDLKPPAVGILLPFNILPKVKGLMSFSAVARGMPDVNFYVAGGGPYSEMVKDAFKETRNVVFMGMLPHPAGVYGFLRAIDVYAHPSGLDGPPYRHSRSIALRQAHCCCKDRGNS